MKRAVHELVQRCRSPRAIATSAAAGQPIAVAGAVGYVISGWHAPDLPPGAVGFVYLPGLLAPECGHGPGGTAGRQAGAPAAGVAPEKSVCQTDSGDGTDAVDTGALNSCGA